MRNLHVSYNTCNLLLWISTKDQTHVVTKAKETEETRGCESEGSRDRHACRHGLPRMRVSSLNSLFALIEIVQEKNT